MSKKLFSKSALAAVALSVVASSAMFSSSTTAQAGYYKHGGHHYSHGHCHWKKRKIWSNYYGHYIWKKVRYCH